MLPTVFKEENCMSTKRKRGNFRSYKNFKKEDFVQDVYQASLHTADFFDDVNDNYWADGYCE